MRLDKIISKCGNRCDLCPLYHGNVEKNERQKIIDGFTKYHGFTMKPDNFDCVGCLKEGKQSRENCNIKKCCINKNVDNCAYCNEMICSLLKMDIEVIEGSLKRNNGLLQKDYDIFYKPYEVVKNLNKIKNDLKKKG